MFKLSSSSDPFLTKLVPPPVLSACPCFYMIKQAFRTDEAVDVSKTGDGSGYSVGWTRAGEYLRYTVDVEEAGERY